MLAVVEPDAHQQPRLDDRTAEPLIADVNFGQAAFGQRVSNAVEATGGKERAIDIGSEVRNGEHVTCGVDHHRLLMSEFPNSCKFHVAPWLRSSSQILAVAPRSVKAKII